MNKDRKDWQRIERVYGQVKWAWGAASDDPQLSDFQWALDTYQCRRRLWTDLVGWLQRVLALAQAQGWQAEEGRFLNNLGIVYDNQGRWADAIQMYEESLRLSRELGDTYGQAFTLMNLGNVYANQEEPQKAEVLWQEALTKLQPDSPTYKQLAAWLQQQERDSHGWVKKSASFISKLLRLRS